MIRTKLFLACALAFVVSLAGTAASAQEPTNQITYFTFSAPFELPGGKTLPAGKYVFKIVDSPSNRHIVTVMSEDQQTVHATLLAIPAQRQDPADEPEVRFMEAEASAAPAVRTWWYPGRTIGHEFIYPKDQARRLAARQREGVLTVAGDATGDDAMRTGDLTRIGANGQEAAVTAQASAAETTASAQTTAQTTPAETSASAAATTSPSTQPAAPDSTASTQSSAATRTAQSTMPERTAAPSTTQPTTTAATERTELPRTASPLPLIALLGLGSLIGAGALRARK
jgi:hypothetical protein